MRVATAWGALAVLTVVGLLYTHSQVRLVQQSYRLNERLAQRDMLHEQCAYLEYDVMALKAPNRLKERLTSFNVELKTPTATHTLPPETPAQDTSARPWTPQWLRALEAEAKPE